MDTHSSQIRFYGSRLKTESNSVGYEDWNYISYISLRKQNAKTNFVLSKNNPRVLNISTDTKPAMRYKIRQVIILVMIFAFFHIIPNCNAETLTVGEGYAFDTIMGAISNAKSGDEIIVYPGTYFENVIIDLDNIRLQSMSGPETTSIESNNNLGEGVLISANNVTVDGFKITGFGKGMRLTSSSNCTIMNNIIQNNNMLGVSGGDGIIIWLNCNYNEIYNNTIYNNGRHGILLGYERGSGTCSYNIISNNTIYDNGGDNKYDSGIRLRNADNNQIINNEIFMVNQALRLTGIYIRDSCDYNAVLNNNISKYKSSIQIHGGRYNEIRNNVFKDNAINEVNLIDPSITTDNVVLNNRIIIPEYELSLISNFGYVVGDGTYSESSTATFTVSPTRVERYGKRHTFTGWTSISNYGYTGTRPEASVEMNGDILEIAEWDIECYLTIYSEVSVEGEGWYPAGRTIQLEIDSPQGFLIRKVFKKWTGDVDPDSHSVSIVMDEPKTVVAEWVTDYSQAYLVGGMSVVLVVGGGYVTREWRRKRRIIRMVARSEEVVVLADLVNVFDVSEDELRVVIEEAVGRGVLDGRFSNEGHTFIPDQLFRKIIHDKLKDNK